jgi:hypothetical protein
LEEDSPFWGLSSMPPGIGLVFDVISVIEALDERKEA